MRLPAICLLITIISIPAIAAAQSRDQGPGAKSPEEVFETASQSVVTIVAIGKRGQAMGLGSGVVVRPQLITTNCHVLKNADAAAVMYQERRYPAKVVDAMVDRDLCLLSVEGLPAQVVQTGSHNRCTSWTKSFRTRCAPWPRINLLGRHGVLAAKNPRFSNHPNHRSHIPGIKRRCITIEGWGLDRNNDDANDPGPES